MLQVFSPAVQNGLDKQGGTGYFNVDLGAGGLQSQGGGISLDPRALVAALPSPRPDADPMALVNTP